jgi:hypothetical protein
VRRRRKAEPGRPSLFFIIALILGVLLLFWIFAQLITTPMTPPKRSALLRLLLFAPAIHRSDRSTFRV